MSHAIHFLERLERIQPAEVELAMALYQDTPLVHELIGRAKVPEGATRVALSLGDPVEGPFVVLERSGAFVTCLARGMRPGDLPIITRAKLESVAGQLTQLRQRIALAKELTGQDEKGAMHELHRRLWVEAYSLTREEMRAAMAFLPVLAEALYAGLANVLPIWRSLRANLSKRHVVERDSQASTDALGALGEIGSCLGTAIQLILTAAAEHPASLSGILTDARLATLASFGLTLDHSFLRARVLNGIGRAGHLLAGPLKHKFTTLQDSGELRALHRHGLGLVACGAAHPKLEAELLKFFERASNVWPLYQFGLHPDRKALEDIVLTKAFAVDEDLATTQGAPRRFASLSEVPLGVATAVATFVGKEAGDPGETTKERLMDEAITACVYGRAGADDLYLPKGVFDGLREVPATRLGEALVRNERASITHRPRVAAARPGRNDPCPCGSGKKFKKCCG